METGKCPCCNKPYEGFKNEKSIQEYRVSLMCQKCQDKFFGEDNEPVANAMCPNCGKAFHDDGGYGGVCSKRCGDSYAAYLKDWK